MHVQIYIVRVALKENKSSLEILEILNQIPEDTIDFFVNYVNIISNYVYIYIAY